MGNSLVHTELSLGKTGIFTIAEESQIPGQIWQRAGSLNHTHKFMYQNSVSPDQWGSVVGHCPSGKEITCSILCQGTCLGYGFEPRLGASERLRM